LLTNQDNVEFSVDWTLYHVPALLKAQIFIAGTDIEKAHIVITVRRSKAPSAARLQSMDLQSGGPLLYNTRQPDGAVPPRPPAQKTYHNGG
jgi:hypothetical protein